MQNEVKNIVVCTFFTMVVMAAFIILLLSSCTIILLHTEGESVDAIDQVQKASPSLNIPIQGPSLGKADVALGQRLN